MRLSHLGAVVLLAVVAAVGPVAAQAQAPHTGPLALGEALQEALQRSPEMVAARQRVAGSQAGLRGARAPANPLFSVAPAVGFGDEASILSQEIDLVGRRRVRGRVAQAELGAAKADFRLVVLNVATDVRAAYFDLVRALRVEETSQEGLRLAQSIRQGVQRQVELGLAPRAQLVRVELELSRVEQELARSQGDTGARRVALNTLLGREPSDITNPSGELVYEALPEGFDATAAQSAEARPEVQAAEQTLLARRAQVDLARLQGKPEVTAELPFGRWRITEAFSRPIKAGDFGLQAHVSFPLFDLGSVSAGVERAKAQAAEQRALVAAVRRSSNGQIQQATAVFASAARVADSYRTAVLPRAEETLSIARAGYEQGFTSFLELLDAQRSYRQVQIEYLAAIFEAVRARAAVDRALGILPVGPGTTTPNVNVSRGAELAVPAIGERKHR